MRAIGAVTQTDINNLRSMLSGVGIVSKIVNIPLRAAEKGAQIGAHALHLCGNAKQQSRRRQLKLDPFAGAKILVQK